MIPITPPVVPSAIDKLPVKGQTQIMPQSGAVSALPVSGSVGKELTEQQRVEAKVKSWVAQSFFGTLMKQMRDSPFKDEMFSGGRGGAAYGNLYDQQIVQRMAVGAGSKLVRQITNKILTGKTADAKRAYGKSVRPVDSLQQSSSPFAAPQGQTPAPQKSSAFKELPRVPAGLRA